MNKKKTSVRGQMRAKELVRNKAQKKAKAKAFEKKVDAYAKTKADDKKRMDKQDKAYKKATMAKINKKMTKSDSTAYSRGFAVPKATWASKKVKAAYAKRKKK